DRTEQRARRARVDVEAQLELLEAVGDRTCLVDRLRLAARTLGVALLDLLHERRRGDLCQTARKQEVARVTAGDVHDLAAQAQLVDVFGEDDFHRHLLGAYVREQS